MRRAPEEYRVDDVARHEARKTALVVARLFGVIFACVFALGVLICWWAGFFDQVQIERTTFGSVTVIYREYRGPYQGLKAVIRDVTMYTRNVTGRAPVKGFSVSFDDPRDVPERALRSMAGCVVNSCPDTLTEPFKCRILPSVYAVVGTFRMRSVFSYMTGVFKFYPLLDSFLRERNLETAGPVVEVYDMAKRRIYYVAPLDTALFLPPQDAALSTEDIGSSVFE